jgi:hypothetical protein
MKENDRVLWIDHSAKREHYTGKMEDSPKDCEFSILSEGQGECRHKE